MELQQEIATAKKNLAKLEKRAKSAKKDNEKRLEQEAQIVSEVLTEIYAYNKKGKKTRLQENLSAKLSSILGTDLPTDAYTGLRCSIDGDQLCVTRHDFIDLQQSPAVFFPFAPEEMAELKTLMEDKNNPLGAGEAKEAEPKTPSEEEPEAKPEEEK